METAFKTRWRIDAGHSEIRFKVMHMMISMVTGQFHDFEAKVETKGFDFIDANTDFTAHVASINTNNKDRDAHLKSNDFFNAAAYPEIRFQSKSFDGRIMYGYLTIRDVTKEVALEVDFNGIAVDLYGQTKAGIRVAGRINRKDYKLKWSAVTDTGSIVVGDTVQLVADLQFIKEEN